MGLCEIMLLWQAVNECTERRAPSDPSDPPQKDGRKEGEKKEG